MPAREVVRPSIPAAWWAAAGLWAGVWLAETIAWRAFSGAGGAVPVLAVSLGLVLLAIVTAARRAPSALAIVGIAAGAVCGAFFWWTWTVQVRSLDHHAPNHWNGEVVSDPSRGAFGESSTVRVRIGGARMLLRVRWPKGGSTPAAGSVCSFFGAYRAPGSDEYGRLQFRDGVAGSVSARLVRVEGWAHSPRGAVGGWRAAWTRRVDRVGGSGGALVAGVVLGDRTRIAGTEAESAFRTTGLTHLIAVSGGHLVVVAALAAWLLSRARARRVLAVGAVLAITGLYVVASGVQPSAVRAWLMSAVLAMSSISGRRGDGMGSLAGAVWIALGVEPSAAFDLGMQLSVVSVAGLLLFARFGESWVGPALPRPLRALASPLAMTLVAQAVTVPLTASAFGMVSLIAPLANLLVSPLVSLLLVLGIGGLALPARPAPLSDIVLRLAGGVGALAVGVAEWLASLPHAAVPLGWAALPASCVAVCLAAAVWTMWPSASARRARACAALAGVLTLALGFGPPATGGPEIVVLDVGQGDAILVRDGPHAALIDAGPDESSLREALLRHGVRSLETVVITHLHDDHYGGIGALTGVVAVGRVLVPRGTLGQKPEACDRFRRVAGEVLEIDAGDRVDVGRWRLDTLWPRGVSPDVATNEASVVLAARLGSFDAVLTGDAESGVLDAIIASEGLGDVEALKVGHHGSADAVSERDLEVLRPEYALISVGKGNRFGHPVRSTLDGLTTSGCRVLRTDEQGDLSIRSDGRRYSVSEQNTSR